MKNKLTIKELDELVGGITYSVAYTPQPTGDDKVNANSTWNCECTYNNYTAVEYNLNSTSTCRCTCF